LSIFALEYLSLKVVRVRAYRASEKSSSVDECCVQARQKFTMTNLVVFFDYNLWQNYCWIYYSKTKLRNHQSCTCTPTIWFRSQIALIIQI